MTDDITPDWEAIRGAYEAGKPTVAEICRRFGVRQTALYAKVRRECWPRRLSRIAARRTSPETRLALVHRLFLRFEQQMAEADARRAKFGFGEADPVGAHEARTLAVLARTLEKLIEIEDTRTRPAGRGLSDAEPQDDAEVERIRAELARRIAGLEGPGAEGGLPGGAAPA